MTNQQKLIDYIKLLSEEQVRILLDAANILLNSQEEFPSPICPHCGSSNVIRYGHKCGKQRFFCKDCGRVFMPTTNTVMSHSHFPASVWKEVITDTVSGNAINYSAKRLGVSHQAVFDMRHKILLALQDLPVVKDALLGDVSELDETFVLDCYKGSRLKPHISRRARRHGAKAAKRGISSEYICICTAIQRKGSAYAESVNRAKPNTVELEQVYTGHIADGTLLLCDGLRSYNVLPLLTVSKTNHYHSNRNVREARLLVI